MEDHVTLQMDDDHIRFTPNGSIAVVDAIAALSEANCPVCLWEDLKQRNPHLDDMCQDYAFPGEDSVAVADNESWIIIQTLLLEHIIDSES